jgi:hypothetical protein
LGNTIYVRGGEVQISEITYNHIFELEFIKQIIGHVNDLDFYITYNDNFGKNHLIQIRNITDRKF